MSKPEFDILGRIELAGWPRAVTRPWLPQIRKCRSRQQVKKGRISAYFEVSCRNRSKVLQCTRCKHQASLTAAEVNQDGHPRRVRLGVVKGFLIKELERWAVRHLRPGVVVRTDGLACHRGVTSAGCQHQPRITGGGKASCETPGLRWVNTLLSNVKRALDGTYHSSFDARYAGRYLAEFQYQFDRGYQLPISYRDSPTSQHGLPRCLSNSLEWLELVRNPEEVWAQDHLLTRGGLARPPTNSSSDQSSARAPFPGHVLA